MQYTNNSAYDVIVIGAGVIGCSAAFHLAQLGAGRVLVLERDQIGSGTSTQSSGILRTHYSVAENVELALRSWQVFNNFEHYLGDDDAASGLVRCGYLIAAADGPKLEPLRSALEGQRAKGIRVDFLDAYQARECLPIAQFENAALIGYEPEAGFADAYLVTNSFARAARRKGVKILEGCCATGLIREGNRVVGVQTNQGDFHAAKVISTQNIWATDIERWTGIPTPVTAERHTVLALECASAPYTFGMPVLKDLDSAGMLYYRSYGGKQMLVSEGGVGETLPAPSNDQGDVPMEYVADVGEQVAQRFEAYAESGLASSWTGVYDVTPDWNPVLGELPDVPGLLVGYGFSGHGFKLSPGVGKLLAQAALGLPTDVSLTPYALERFRTGQLLVGKYGAGAVS